MRGCAILEKSPNKAFFLRRTVLCVHPPIGSLVYSNYLQLMSLE